MNFATIPYRSRVHSFAWPSIWDEIHPQTFHALLPLIKEAQASLILYQESEDSEPADLVLQDLRIKMLWKLLNLRWYHWRKKRAFLSLYADELSDLLNTTDFLLERPQRNKPPFEELKVGRIKLIPPGHALQNLSAEEFHFLGLHLQKLSALNFPREDSLQSPVSNKLRDKVIRMEVIHCEKSDLPFKIQLQPKRRGTSESYLEREFRRI